jgi:arylsulfatase A-like enzyme
MIPRPLLLLPGIALFAASADAACLLRDDARALEKSLRRSAHCRSELLRKGPAVACEESAPPVCAEELAEDVLALAYGPTPPSQAVDRRALAKQLTCQEKIGRAAAKYAGRRLRALQKGQPPEQAGQRARRGLEHLARRCDVLVLADASGVVLPAVGSQCAAAVGAPGAVARGASLGACLTSLIGVWVDRIAPDPRPLRPNIVLVLTDDQRFDSVGPTHALPGQDDAMPRTRARLRAQGVEFSRAFVTTPLCCPSRASILAGSYAHRTGVYKNSADNGGADDFEDASSVATWLEDAGYRTSLVGKYLNGYAQLWGASEPPYVPPGWTDWRGMEQVRFFDYRIVEPDGLGGYASVSYGSAPEDYSTDVLREKAKQFVSESAATGEPFFLYLSFKAPHLPQTPAPRHEGLFEGIAPWRPPSWNEADVSDKPAWVQATPPLDALAEADLDQVRIDQLEMLQAVDEAIAGAPELGIVGLLEHLEALGVADETLVVFLSDNGWLWGEHRMRAKNNPYEEAIRSPMWLLYPPLAPQPRTEARFALNIDLAPTFAELAGVSVPIGHDGESLLRVIDGTVRSWRSDFLTEGWPGSHPWATVREERWKYTELPLVPGDPATGFELELYDLASDSYELDNRAADPAHAERIAAMAARLRELRPNWPVDSDAGLPDPPEEAE